MIDVIPRLERIELRDPVVPIGERILQALDRYFEGGNLGGIVRVDVPHDMEVFMGTSDEAVYCGRASGGTGMYAFGQHGLFVLKGPGRDIVSASIPPYTLKLRDDGPRLFFDFDGEIGEYTCINAEIERLKPGNMMYDVWESRLKVGGLLE